MILCLIGPNAFVRTQRLRVLRRGFMQKYDERGLNMQEFEGKDIDVDAFRQAVSGGGLFATKRFVVWRDPFAASVDVRDQVSELLTQVHADSIVVLVADEIPKKKDALVELMQSAKQEQFPDFTSQERIQWIMQAVRQAGAQIDFPAARFMAEAVGSDLWQAWNQIQKSASRSATITQADLEKELADPVHGSAFGFADAITARNAKLSLQLLHEQLAAGLSPFQLLAMIVRQLAVLAQLKETQGQGSSLHPFVIKKNLSATQRLTAEELQQARTRLLQDEINIKTGQVDPVVALDLFVVDWCR